MDPSTKIDMEIAHTWHGQPIPAGQRIRLSLEPARDTLVLHIDAPYAGDPPPAAPPGPTDHLWEHEVVELFLLGPGERYLEIELGPHGHHLVIKLCGTRNVEATLLPIRYRAEIEGCRWRGRAVIPASCLPLPVMRANAYAMHGLGEARRHLALFPLGGEAPDFHRLADFGPLAIDLPG